MWAVPIAERPPTQRFRCAARQGRQPAQLTHCSFPYARDLLGKALPLATGRLRRLMGDLLKRTEKALTRSAV